MTEPAAILEVRHVRLAEQATLSPAPLAEGDEGVFVAHDEPPPVRTVLTVQQDDARRVLEVVRVVEVADRDERGTRGFYGRWVDEEALARATKVGTEHLEDGTPVVQPVMPDHSAALPVSDAPAMAVPAPVMMDVDDTGVIDVGDREDADETEVDENAMTTHYDQPAEAMAAEGEGSADGETSEAEATEQEQAADGEAPAESETSEDEATEQEQAADGDASEDHSEAADGDASDSEAQAPADGDANDATQQDRSGNKRRGGRRKRGKRRR